MTKNEKAAVIKKEKALKRMISHLILASDSGDYAVVANRIEQQLLKFKDTK